MITEQQEKFIFLAHVDCISFSAIEMELNVSRTTLSQWENELRPIWKEIASIKKIHSKKQIKIPFKEFYEWYKVKSQNRICEYCGIKESEIQILFDKKLLETKRKRGKKLELDRKIPNSLYDEIENIAFACYWCNQAKTDTFTHEEFKEVGKVISDIWEKEIDKW